MNWSPTLCAFGIAACTLVAAPERVAFFSTGDRIPGTIDARKEAEIILSSPALAAPARIGLDKLLEVRSEVETPEQQGEHEAVVTLTNGNVLRGRLSDLPDETIVLDTWYAGTLELRRVMVDSLQIIDRGNAIYSGPNGPDGWVFAPGHTDKPPWRFTAGTMVSQAPGSIARDLDLPKQISVSFDLAWRDTLDLRMILFSDDVKSEAPSNAYVLSFERMQAVLRKQFTDGAATHRSTIKRTSVAALSSKEKVRVEFFADRSAGKFMLKIDGKKIDEIWEDPNPGGAKLGGGMHFIAENDTQVRISRLRVHEWDGRFGLQAAEDDEEDEPETAEGYQKIRLRNGDILTGRVLGVEEERLKIETAHGEVMLPVARMTSAMLHREEDKEDPVLYQKPKLMKGDVRAWFADGGYVVFRLDEVNDNDFLGYSQTFGDAKFRRNAFRRVEFNIYKPELEPLRPSSSAW
jgi:hypothetical protein